MVQSLPHARREAPNILDALVDDLPPVLRRGVRQAARRYGLRLSSDARVDLAMFSRDLSPAAGASTSTSLDVDLPFVCAGFGVRFFSSSAADDSSMVGIRLLQSNGAGYLVGDSQAGLNAASLAELDTYFQAPLAWLLVPREILTLTAELDAAAAGTVTVTVFFFGVYLRGFGIGVGSN